MLRFHYVEEPAELHHVRGEFRDDVLVSSNDDAREGPAVVAQDGEYAALRHGNRGVWVFCLYTLLIENRARAVR